MRVPRHLAMEMAMSATIVSVCATTALHQGAPGPVARPEAASTIHLPDDLCLRACLGEADQLFRFAIRHVSEAGRKHGQTAAAIETTLKEVRTEL
jgi:hypothetical protein